VLATLDTANIAAIKTRLMRQPFLRHIEFTPRSANSLPKNVEIRVHLPKSRESGLLVHGV
jgi:hypothetical protein